MTMKYTKDHEWIKLDGDIATIGITKHAADALGELVYVELPKIGASFAKGGAIAVVESSKSASDVYSPISGEVIAINESLVSAPENINNDPYNNGWLVKVRLCNSGDLEDAMDEQSYQKYLSENQ